MTRRASVTHKIRVGTRRTVYLSTQDSSPPLELFVRVRGTDVSAETVALYDCLARLVSIALQHGAPLETVGRPRRSKPQCLRPGPISRLAAYVRYLWYPPAPYARRR